MFSNYAFITWNTSLNNRRAAAETDVNFTSYTPTNYFYTEKVNAFVNSYSMGNTVLSVLSDPRYLVGEGYGTSINKGGNIQSSFGNLNVFPSSSLPVYIKTSFSGTSSAFISGINYDHQVKLDYLDNLNTYGALNDTTFSGYSQLCIEKQITSDKLQDNSVVRVNSVSNPLFLSLNNSTNIHYIYLKYPQKPDFLNTNEQLFFVDDNPVALKSFLEIQNVNVGSSQILFYDLTNHKYIFTSTAGNTVKALIPNSSNQKKCFLTTTANIKTVSVLQPVNQTGFFTNYKTTNTDSAFVIITHKSLQAPSNDYKVYRESVSGGSNYVINADIDDLYDQFAYGNAKNPIAIKNFCKFLSDSLPSPPKYLLLIGKSIKNSQVKNNSTNWINCKIPTMGNPSSDNLFTTGIRGSNAITPFIPVGRLSATNATQVTNYLEKVKEHEQGLAQNPPADWHKRILHFSGGADLGQQQAFKSYLESFGNIIKDTLYGARVFSFAKTTTSPIQINVSDSIEKLINYGASVITFFGHGSVTGFDQAIDDPSIYNNQGKYPLFIANSCYSGDIHTPNTISASENY